MTRTRWAAAAACAILLGACVPLGPSTIIWSRTQYNKAVQQTEAQQLLLNIVRQRFNDPVLFLDLTNISSTTTRSANLNLSTFMPSGGAPDSVSGALGGAITESPLIFYAPNTGEKFVRQILSPLDLKTLSLLLQAGWSIERVLLVAGDAINGIRNSTAGTGPGNVAPYATYRELVAALRDLQRDGRLTASMAPSGDALELTPSADARGSPAYQAVCRILSLACDGAPIRFRLGIGTAPAGSGAVTLTTRSLYAAIYFLSDGVDVPSDDLSRGAVQRRNVSGGPFEGGGELFHIRESAEDPETATVKVRYRNSWYYVAETDSDTKTTFALMSMMLMLQGGDANRLQPLVSVPSG